MNMKFRLFLLCCVVLIACKKDEDGTPPAISIQQPTDGFQANVFDAVHLVIEVSDDVALSRVEIKLVDINLIGAMSVGILNVTGTAATLQTDYVLDDITLSTGQYYIMATAYDDAGNSTKDYVMLNITEVPRELKGIFAVTTTPGFVTLHSIDSIWNASTFGTYQGDFTDLAVSSWWQQVAYTGAYTGMFRMLSIDGNYPGWTANAFPSTGPYWGNTISHGRDWLINYRADGILKTTTWNGTTISTNNANVGYFFRNFVYSADKLFADMVDATGTSRLLGVYVSSGGAIQQSAMNLDPVVLLPRDENTIYAVGNFGGQGKLLIYDYNLNGFWEPIALPSGQVLSATEIDPSTLLIAMNDGNIYKFTYSPVGLLAWMNVTAQHIRYDEAGGTVITCEGTSIKQYDYPQTGILNQVALPDTAMDVELLYNR